MGLIASGKTDVGKKRKTNQDSFYLGVENRLFIVADGMGGHSGGDIASQLAVKVIPEYIQNNSSLAPSTLLLNSFYQSNKSIKDYADKHPELVGMGTTLVAFLFRGQNLYIGNVGDSRAYLINNKKIFQLSKDHSLVQEKLNFGVYTREQAALDPQKNVLVKSVGFEDELEADLFVYKVNKNDVFICCSDGLHGKVSDEDMVYLVNKYIPDPSKATQAVADFVVKSLIDQANANGGQDNITAILVIAQ